MVEINNFIEYETVEEANTVDLQKFTFVGLRSDRYVFKIRQR